jgi:hypothetical protein
MPAAAPPTRRRAGIGIVRVTTGRAISRARTATRPVDQLPRGRQRCANRRMCSAAISTAFSSACAKIHVWGRSSMPFPTGLSSDRCDTQRRTVDGSRQVGGDVAHVVDLLVMCARGSCEAWNRRASSNAGATVRTLDPDDTCPTRRGARLARQARTAVHQVDPDFFGGISAAEARKLPPQARGSRWPINADLVGEHHCAPTGCRRAMTRRRCRYCTALAKARTAAASVPGGRWP